MLLDFSPFFGIGFFSVLEFSHLWIWIWMKAGRIFSVAELEVVRFVIPRQRNDLNNCISVSGGDWAIGF